MVEVALRRIEIPPRGIHLTVETQVNGVTANLVLDTGASRSVVDLDFLRSFSPAITLIEEEGESTGVGSASLTSFLSEPLSFSIGELVLDNVELTSLDLTHVKLSYEKMGEEPIHGVLGGDILDQYQAVIDYSKSILRLNN